MTNPARIIIRKKVLKYVSEQHTPVRIGTLAAKIGKDVSEVRAVVQPMIVTGKLDYAPGLTITLGKKTK